MRKKESSPQIRQRSTSGKNQNFFKSQASILLKQIRQSSLIVEDSLRHRLMQCGHLHLLEHPTRAQRKHALNIISLEYGFSSWSKLKQRLEMEARLNLDTFFCGSGLGGMLNHWFTCYADAKSHQRDYGGILLPYRNQYFVTVKAFLERLGMKQEDPDWRAIGYDWIYPTCQKAKHAIICRLIKAL